MVFDPFHHCAFCERAAPDAPETIDDQRRCTGCRYRTIYGGSPRERIPTGAGEVARSYHSYGVYQPFNLTEAFPADRWPPAGDRSVFAGRYGP